jgi:hypothetical protein
MALVVQQHVPAALTKWNSSYLLKSKVYLCSFSNVVTKNCISWTATRPSPFNPMKIKVLIVQQRYTSALSSTSSQMMALVVQQHAPAALSQWNSSYSLKSKVYICSFFNVVTNDGISGTATRPGRFNPMKIKLLIENYSYTSPLSSTSSLMMALVGQQHAPAALTQWNLSCSLKRKFIPLLFLQRRHYRWH